MRPGLTLLCITKDQAPKLLRMLQSVQGVVDDIVVFDTGSKDLSPGVARTQGARVFQIEWPGSFSEALNQAMAEVETEWTLRLDSDEWLRPESGPQIRRLIEDKQVFAYYLIRQDLSDEEHFSECLLLRLWRTNPSLKFRGYIHEHFPDELLERLAKGRRVAEAPVRFLHDGFVGGTSPEKLRRNAELLRKELEARPGQLYYEVELATTLAVLRDPEGPQMVDRMVDQVLERSAAPDPIAATLLCTALAQVRRRDLGSDRTSRIIEKGWEWFDASPPMLWSIAQVQLRRVDSEGAYRALLRLEELATSGEYQREFTFDSRILGDALWSFLCQVAASLGHAEVAERCRARISTETG